MSDDWFVKFGPDVHGPITSAQLKMLARKGVIKPGFPVRRGQSKWIPASKVRGLLGPTEPEETTKLREPPASSIPEPPPAPEPAAEPTSLPEPNPLQAIGLGQAEPPPARPTTDEGLALPIDLHLDVEPHLADHPHPVEPLPDHPGEAEDQAGPASRRRPYLRYEGTVRSIGLFFYANAFLSLGLAVGWALWVLRRLDGMTAANLRGFYIEVLGTGAALLAAIGAGFLLGEGLRALRTWARWVTATLMIESVLGSAVAEMMLAIVASPMALRAAVLLVFVGMLAPGYIAFMMLHREGDVVFSTSYRDWAAHSPGLRTRRSWAVALLLLVEGTVVGFALYLASS